MIPESMVKHESLQEIVKEKANHRPNIKIKKPHDVIIRRHSTVEFHKVLSYIFFSI